MRHGFLGWLILPLLFVCACSGEMSPPSAQSSSPKPGASEGWISSGGGMLRDAKNPWWVKNTTSVTYCIRIDSESVSNEEAFVDKTFQEAVSAWRKDLESVKKSLREFGGMPDYDGSGVGIQEFKKISCDENPDLKLLLGYGALGEKERAYFTEPETYAALTVRTQYDRKTLKGKGFIYLGSESGPHRFHQDKYKFPWRVGDVLGDALVHELGHVFGVPHLSPEISYHMQEGALERLFQGKPSDDSDYTEYRFLPITTLLSLDSSLMFGVLGTKYRLNSNFAKFFEIKSWGDSAYNCQLNKKDDQKDTPFFRRIMVFDPYWKDAVTGKSIDVNIATIENPAMRLKRQPVVSIYLTKEQEVFEGLDFSKHGFLRLKGPPHLKAVGSGQAKLGSGKTKPVYFEIGRGYEVTFFGDIDGEIQELKPTGDSTETLFED